MQVYHFTSATHALSNIEKRRLKIAELSKLNDPFDWAAPAFKKKSDRWAMQATKREMGLLYGIVCFSAGWRNPVQWSHYADHHRGVCLGFEVDDQYLTKVTYQAERPELASFKAMQAAGALTREWLMQAISTKFSHWAYEEEYRVFVPLDPAYMDKGLYFKYFDGSMLLTQVIVGPEATVSRAEVDTALGDLGEGVRRTKARLAFKTFEVCEQLDAARWK